MKTQETKEENKFTPEMAYAYMGSMTMMEAMMRSGPTHEEVAKELKRELYANKSVRAKVKGAVTKEHLDKGKRVIAISGLVTTNRQGQKVYGDGDTVLEWDEADNQIRQGAVDIIARLFGAYPGQKISLDFGNGEELDNASPEDVRFMRKLATQYSKYKLEQSKKKSGK